MSNQDTVYKNNVSCNKLEHKCLSCNISLEISHPKQQYCSVCNIERSKIHTKNFRDKRKREKSISLNLRISEFRGICFVCKKINVTTKIIDGVVMCNECGERK